MTERERETAEWLEVVAGLAPQIEAAAEEIETGRRLLPQLARAFAEAGLFRLMVPRALGGAEAHPATMFAVVEAVARIDGSAGWVVMIGAGTAGYVCSHLAPEAGATIFRDPNVVLGGLLPPAGRAVPVADGYRVTGRWPFGSGCQHCGWLASGTTVIEGDAPRQRADGSNETRVVVTPAADAEILDTWHVAGLRGTGSHDYTLTDVFVLAAFTFDPATAAQTQPGPLYAARFYLIAHAAQALGVARHAIEALTDLAGRKRPQRAAHLLRERGGVQGQVGRAEALVGAARAYVLAMIDEIWSSVSAGRSPTPKQQVRMRLAITHAVQSSAQAVDLMYDAGGATSIYTSSPLERCFRDIHVATQHAVVATRSYELGGRGLLGLEPGGPAVF